MRTWPIVAFTFVVLMALSGIVTIATLGSINGLRSSVLDLTDTYHRRQEQIEALRSNIYASSVIVRDLLLERSPLSLRTNPPALRANQAAAERSIAELGRMSSPGTEATMRALFAEVRAYWSAIDALMTRAALSAAAANDFAYLQQAVLPRRQAVITLAEELSDVSNAEARAGRENVSDSITSFRQQTILLRAFASAATLLLFGVCLLRVYRLERVAGVEQARVEEAEAELRDLSRQLVNAHEQERRTLSRELHDHIGQMMTALRFGLSEIEQHCPSPTPQFSAALRDCRSILERTIEEVRGVAMGLRPSMLDDLGLSAAIQWQAREFGRRYDLPVTVRIDPELADCPEPQRTALYRIAQEALTNCARHANAKNILIHLLSHDGHVTLQVTDDGSGMRAGQSRRGFGLIGMEERVREIGGTLSVQSAAGVGTTIIADLPTASSAAAG